MKISIEAGSFYGKRTGVGRYALCVSQALVRLRTGDNFTFFSFLRPGRIAERDFTMPGEVRYRYIRWFPGRVFSLLMRKGISLPMELLGLWGADLYIFPNFITWASLLPRKRLCVVHDVSFLFFPEYIQAKNLAFLRRQLQKSLRRSAGVIAVSETTKQDLIREYAIPEQKVGVVYNAVDHTVFNPQAADRLEQVRQKFKLPKNYIMFLSSIEPRKNLEGLLRAYGQSYERHRAALVIVGGGKGWTWNSEGIEKQFKKLTNLPIYRLGFVNDEDAAALYAGAQAFVYPSFYEGFGIPVLEAMASGCPVICSSIPSHLEIIGQAAITVEARDTKGLAQAITKLLADTNLRRQLSSAGLKQAERYTWEYSARQLSEFIDSLA